ncbi:hypothetical protein D3C73_1294830 [compost metagenome]
MHEVHRPTQIRLVGHCQWLRLGTHQPLPGFYPQIELKLPINPVHPLVVPAKPFDVAQIEKAEPEAPVALAGCDAQQPVSNLLVFIGQHGLIAIAALAHLEHLASQTNRDGVVSHGLGRHLPAGRWRHPFFAIAS